MSSSPGQFYFVNEGVYFIYHTSGQQSDFTFLRRSYFRLPSHLRIKPSRKFLNVQYYDSKSKMQYILAIIEGLDGV